MCGISFSGKCFTEAAMTVPPFSALLVAGMLAFSALALAGGGGAVMASTVADAPAAILNPAPDDHELSRFVSAFVRLIGVQHGYMMMMHDENDPVRIAEMKRQAVEDMTSAVEKDGMTVERYNAIAIALKQDTALQGRVESILHEMADAPDSGAAPPEED
jgi:Domain of unknown function (DUF4168)